MEGRVQITAKNVRLLLLFCLAFLMMIACNFLGEADQSYRSTLVALKIQQTSLALGRATLTQAVAEGSPPLMVTSAPERSNPPTAFPTATPDAPTPTVELPPGALDDRTLQSARILLFEDMSASGQVRYVMESLDQAHNYYLDVGSAKGWFKTQLLSHQQWDLIIAAAEADRNFGGEYFELILKRVEEGAAAIIEFRDLDAAPNGLSKPFLDRCGVEYQSDWYEPDTRVFFPLAPDHPVFQEPNAGLSSWRTGAPLWEGDVGDLLRIKTSGGQVEGDALLLAGTSAGWKKDHGLLATCFDGRVILQTFPSHEVYHGDMVRLWQNYVYNTLKNHFMIVSPPAPEPVLAIRPSPTPLEPVPVPVPQVSDEYACGEVFRARLTKPPQYQVDLFEHHASGEFAILRLELINQTVHPVFIWDGDYHIEANVNGKAIRYEPDKAATGYLYIESPSNLYQDRIEAGQTWRTTVAFDIHPASSQRVLVIRPGIEFNEPVCEVRIPVSQ